MHTTESLWVDYFDGRAGHATPARLMVQAGWLELTGLDGALLRRERVQQVTWPERQRHGQRQAYLPGHGVVAAPDAAAWDAWAAACGMAQPAVVAWQQSWQRVLLVLVVALVGLGVAWRWGVPWLATQAANSAPQTVLDEAGATTLQALERAGLVASELPAERQAALARRWQQASRQAGPDMPATRLLFRQAGRSGFGPNALALPDGTVVITDELVKLLADREDVLIGVLGHEAGHVQRRHGVRLVLQTALVGLAATALVGDFSALLAGLPAVMSRGAYSRDMEREADAAAVQLLRANGLSPAAMVEFFDRLAADRARRGEPDAAWLIAFSSHPADADRVRYFREAAGER